MRSATDLTSGAFGIGPPQPAPPASAHRARCSRNPGTRRLQCRKRSQSHHDINSRRLVKVKFAGTSRS